MNTPEKCPHCGAEEAPKDDGWDKWTCGTLIEEHFSSVVRIDIRYSRTDLCREREARQKAEKALLKKADQLSIKECELASIKCDLAYSRAENQKLRELLDEAKEWLLELQSAWDWKADEPRAGNQREYLQLQETIKKINQLTK